MLRATHLSPIPQPPTYTMAGGSAKRTAAQNDTAVKNLHIGMASSTAASLALRLLFLRRSWPPSAFSVILLVLSYVPSALLWNYLVKLGSPRRSPRGDVLSPGEDLNQPGITEYCFDVLYITCTFSLASIMIHQPTWVPIGACQVGSAVFGNWVWWFYSVVSLRPVFLFAGNMTLSY